MSDDAEWRTISIHYAVASRGDVGAVEDRIIELALAELGCDCTEDDPDDKVCGAGEWVAGARPSRLHCNGGG